MILSKQQEFSDAQSITATTQLSTNIVDLGSPGTVLGAPTALSRDIGPGTPIPIVIQVATAFSGAGTFSAEIQASSTTSFTGATVLAKTGDLTATTLVSGYKMPITVVPNDANLRYLGVYYNRSTSSLTGTVDASIVAAVQTNKAAGRS